MDRFPIRPQHVLSSHVEVSARRLQTDPVHGHTPKLTRVFDLVVSVAGLFVTAPLLALAGLATLLDSGRPILYRSRRVGLHGKDFTLLKIRTMTADNRGPSVTALGDARITRVGEILRHSKIDELPQLWNVMKGDMTLVGPRPELREYVEMFPDEFRTIHSVRPGLTGVASITYRNESALLAECSSPEAMYVEEILPAKIQMELEYVKSRSLKLDLLLISKTFRALISPE